MYNYSKYKPSGNKAIDFCMNLIGCARTNGLAIKTMHLQSQYYEWFKSGVQTFLDRPLQEGELMQLDGVNIELGGKFQSKPVLVEYYESLAEA
jgi:hypothetical protein